MSKTKSYRPPVPTKALAVQPSHQVAPTEGESILTAILEAAKNPATNPEVMRTIVELQIAVMDKKSEIAFNKALALVEQELPTITKSKTANIIKNGAVSYSYNYADIAAIDEKIRPILRRHGFSLSFDTKFEGTRAVYEGTLTHEDGHKRRAHIGLPDDKSGGKNELQAVGSTKSYARRYLIMDLLNIVTADDNDAATEGKKISDKQIEWIGGVIDSERIDPAKFMAFISERFGVESIGDIPLEGLSEVEKMINSRQHYNKHDITKAPR